MKEGARILRVKPLSGCKVTTQRKQITSKALGIALACLMVGTMFGISPSVVAAAKFEIGGTVEVYNTGSSGLVVRDAPSGNQIGGKFDGDRGVVLDGPVYSSNYNRWLIRWSDGLEGWSAEDWLREKYVAPSTKFSVGDHVEVYNVGDIGLSVRTGSPELAFIKKVYDGTHGTIEAGPYYGVPKGGEGFYHFWKVDYGAGTMGWSAEDWLKVEPAKPDLTVTSVSFTPSQGNSLSVTFTVKNQGTVASGSFYNRIFLAITKWGTDINLGYFSMSLAAGESKQETRSVTVPSGTSGYYWVTVWADAYQSVSEKDEYNNIGSSDPNKFYVPPPEPNKPDLIVTSVNAPTTVSPGGYIAVSWTVKNQGNASSGLFYNRISLATTPYGTDISLGNYPMDSIAPGSSLSDAQVPKIPETVSLGYYYVTVYADTFEDIAESDEYNNINKATNQIHVIVETISTPDTPAGPSSGEVGQSLTYSTGGASSNLGHSLQYRFDWGDGTYSSWSSSTSASHSWSSPGTYTVRAQARCATHTSVVSSWSGGKNVVINGGTLGYVLHVESSPITGVSISYSGDHGGMGTTNFNIGPHTSPFTVTLTTPSTYGNYEFDHWQLDGVNKGNSTSLSVAVDDTNEERTAKSFYIMPPTVTTQAAYSVGETTATLNGTITDTGGENPSRRGFEWGTSSGSYARSWTETGSFGTGAFSHGLTGLNEGQTYYYRAKAYNSAGWRYGEEQSFTTMFVEAPTIGYEPTSFSFTATEGGSNPLSKILYIWNSGGGTLSWSVSDDAGCLTLYPPSGTSIGETDTVALSVNISEMDAGEYNAVIIISAPEATNTSQTVPVTLIIDPMDVPDVDPISSIDFGSVLVGQSQTDSTAIRNSGNDILRIYSITRTGSSDFTYIGPSTPFDVSASSSREITIEFTPSSVGPKSATFTVSSNDPDEPSVTFSVSGSGVTHERARGIDVSHWQGGIDWNRVHGAGYEFAFVKATEGVGWRDSNFETNMSKGRAAGMLMGTYHFARPDLGNDAADEARYFVSVVREYLKEGYLRPALDLEKGAGLGKEALSNWVHKWMNTVESETGVEPILYVNSNYARNYLDTSIAQYDLWIAHWTYDPEATPNTGIWGNWAFWQYSDSGSVPGIAGNVDLDLFNGSKSELYNFVISFQTGTIEVTSDPLGASFNLSGPTSYSGTTPWTNANAPAGTYTITWAPISGYETPLSESKTLTQDGTISFHGQYSSVPVITLTSPLKITPEKDEYNVGDVLTAEFTIANEGEVSITLDVLTVGGRDPDDQVADFTWRRNITLNPNASYNYEGSLTLSKVGNYHFFCAFYIENPTPEEEKLLDINNWNTCVELGEGLTDEDRIEDITVELPEEYMYAPTLRFDAGELYYPVDWFFDNDKDVENNFTNYDKSSLSGRQKPHVFVHVVNDYEYGILRYRAIQYWYYYVYNDQNLEIFHWKHYHDWVLAMVLLDRDTGDPEYLYLQYHFFNREYRWGEVEPFLEGGTHPVLNVEGGSHEFLDLMDIEDERIHHNSFIIKRDGEYEQEPDTFGDYDAPWERVIWNKYGLLDQAKQIGKGISKTLTAGLRSQAELRIYDSENRVTGLENGEIKEDIPYSSCFDNTVVIFYPSDSYRYEVVGTDEGMYGLDIALIENGEASTLTIPNVSTSARVVHQYTVDWEAIALSGGEKGITMLENGREIPTPPVRIIMPGLVVVETTQDLPEFVRIDGRLEIYLMNVLPETPFELRLENSRISRIWMDLKEARENVRATIEKLEERPPELPDPPGLVWAYHRIEVNVPEDAIENAEIDFWIPKEWLATHGVSKGNVRLLRFGEGWEELTTEIVGENATHVSYRAGTPGFSVFAITAYAPPAEVLPLEINMMLVGALVAVILIAVFVWKLKPRGRAGYRKRGRENTSKRRRKDKKLRWMLRRRT